MKSCNSENGLSIADALKILLDKNDLPAEVDLLDEFEKEVITCQIRLIEAKEAGRPQKIREATLAQRKASQRFEYTSGLRMKLIAEITRERQGKLSIIRISKDTQGDIHCDHVRIEKRSFFDWVKQQQIQIGLSHLPTPRTHTTELLELLDELINKFWEGHDPTHPPKNHSILDYIKDKYGDWDKNDCVVPGASDAVFMHMCKIMRSDS